MTTQHRMLLRLAAVAVLGWTANANAQGEDVAKEIAAAFIEQHLPAFVELYRFDTENNDQSLAFRYDWNMENDWVDEVDGSESGFSGSRSNIFARGNYVFGDDDNPSEMSELGASYTRRWFPIYDGNPLTTEQGIEVQQCVDASDDFEVDAESCREDLGFGGTELTYWYVSVDGHIKIEGDQEFDQRSYVYGFEANLSKDFGSQNFISHPILTLGVEQVDPKGVEAREAVMASDDVYTRAYGELGFAGRLGKFGDHNVKLNVSYRYYQELDPEDVIEDAGLDQFDYLVVAIQIPAAVIPGLDNSANSFVLSYADGELPYSASSERSFEIGFRHNVDFAQLFGGAGQ